MTTPNYYYEWWKNPEARVHVARYKTERAYQAEAAKAAEFGWVVTAQSIDRSARKAACCLFGLLGLFFSKKAIVVNYSRPAAPATAAPESGPTTPPRPGAAG